MELVVQAARPLALALLLGRLHCRRRALGRAGVAERTAATILGCLPQRSCRVCGAWPPAAAVSLSSLQPAAAWSELFAARVLVNGRHLQHEEGRSDGDQRREDWHRCGGRGEDLCVCCEHWQLNRHQLAAEPSHGRQSAESWGLATKRSSSQRYVLYTRRRRRDVHATPAQASRTTLTGRCGSR